jgi:hypothetical protein
MNFCFTYNCCSFKLTSCFSGCFLSDTNMYFAHLYHMPCTQRALNTVSLYKLFLTKRCAVAHKIRQTHISTSLQSSITNTPSVKMLCAQNIASPDFVFVLFCFMLIVLYHDQQMHNYLNKLSHSYMFRHYRVILRELVINSLPSYTSISDAAVGNPIYN